MGRSGVALQGKLTVKGCLWFAKPAEAGVVQANRNLGMVPSLARPILLGANTLGNKLTDVAVELVPEHVDRGTVGSSTLKARCNWCGNIQNAPVMAHAGRVCCQGRLSVAGCCYCQKPAWGKFPIASC